MSTYFLKKNYFLGVYHKGSERKFCVHYYTDIYCNKTKVKENCNDALSAISTGLVMAGYRLVGNWFDEGKKKVTGQ